MFFLIVRAYIALIRFDLFLARGDFAGLYDTVSLPNLPAVEFDDDITRKICSAVDLACVWYWKHVLCLQRSAAAACLLRDSGVPAELVIGAQHMPFRAHAWVEVEGRVVNDKSYTNEMYAVLDDADLKAEVRGPMGLICGQWTFADPVDRERPARLPFAGIADAASSSTIFCDEDFCLMARGFSVVKLHGLSRRPANVESNSFLVWDGRLDNASDVARELELLSTPKARTPEIVAAAYEKWNTDAFRRFKGDWALTIWKVQEQRLILAKDPIGTHPLFFSLTPRGLIWSSSLAWIVQNSAASLSLNFEYLAGWLAFFPSAALTPYSGIEAVPAACFVSFETGRAVIAILGL